MIDVVLGLTEIDSGEISIGEKALCSSNKSAYQSTIGYVPQDIFILNGTIAENIMFGLDEEIVDQSLLNQVIKTVSLDEFFEATNQTPLLSIMVLVFGTKTENTWRVGSES